MQNNLKDFKNHMWNEIKDIEHALGIMYLMTSWQQREIGPQGLVRDCINCYDEISRLSERPNEDRYDYVVGDKVPTLEELKSKFQSVIYDQEMSKPEFGTKKYDKYRLEDGHVDSNMIREIYNFWNTIDVKKVESVIYGSYVDDYDIELDGRREYFLSDESLIAMLYSYSHYGDEIRYDEDKVYNTDVVNEAFYDMPEAPKSWQNVKKEDFEACLKGFEDAMRSRAVEKYNEAIDNAVRAAYGHVDLMSFVAELEPLKIKIKE